MWSNLHCYVNAGHLFSLSRSLISEYVSIRQGAITSMGKFMEWYINERDQVVHGLKLPSGFQLIGQTTLADYQAWIQYHKLKLKESIKGIEPVTKRVYARVGLMGNPSDGFYGKTISLSIANFWAEVTIIQSKILTLIPNFLSDPTEFGSLQDLHDIYGREGYLGGLRLVQATCKMFCRHCKEVGIPTDRNFTLKYETNIPRQVRNGQKLKRSQAHGFNKIQYTGIDKK